MSVIFGFEIIMNITSGQKCCEHRFILNTNGREIDNHGNSAKPGRA